MRSFQDNRITVNAPGNGTCVLEVSACGDILWRSADITLSAGTNQIMWDGLAFDGEPIHQAKYTMTVRFTGADGSQNTADQDFSMSRPARALLYIIPDSDTLWLDSGRNWFLCYQTTDPCDVIMQITTADEPDKVLGTVKLPSKKGAARYSWNGKFNGKALPAGKYRAVCYAKSAQRWQKELRFTIAEGAPEAPAVGVTGPIIPSRHATDEEIWAMLTAPAVIIDTPEGFRNPIYASAAGDSEVVGYVHGSSTAVEVIRIEEDGKWAYIGAWNLTEAYYVEGYVRLKDLKAVTPAQDYALLIDKQTQTLSIFAYGKRAVTLRVSTGNASLKHETEAGSYLTRTRLKSFSTDSFRYDYPFRINGKTLVHSVGWKGVNGFLSYQTENAGLGTKASHGCVRVERTTEGGYNAWWLWTHLRWNTRVIIMDDPEQRAIDNQAAHMTGCEDMPYTGAGTNGWD